MLKCINFNQLRDWITQIHVYSMKSANNINRFATLATSVGGPHGFDAYITVSISPDNTPHIDKRILS